jgi:hypothetical protein
MIWAAEIGPAVIVMGGTLIMAQFIINGTID